MKRPNRKNTKLIRDIVSIPNNQGNVLPYVNRVNAYCKRVGIHNKGCSDFMKIWKQ